MNIYYFINCLLHEKLEFLTGQRFIRGVVAINDVSKEKYCMFFRIMSVCVSFNHKVYFYASKRKGFNRKDMNLFLQW